MFKWNLTRRKHTRREQRIPQKNTNPIIGALEKGTHVDLGRKVYLLVFLKLKINNQMYILR